MCRYCAVGIRTGYLSSNGRLAAKMEPLRDMERRMWSGSCGELQVICGSTKVVAGEGWLSPGYYLGYPELRHASRLHLSTNVLQHDSLQPVTCCYMHTSLPVYPNTGQAVQRAAHERTLYTTVLLSLGLHCELA